MKVKGIVVERPEGTINNKIKTGEIEVDVNEIEVLSVSDTPPFEIKDDLVINEEIRLKYRYLDLRRATMVKKT